ncbi:Protein dispatched 1 [Desmophyllum pertusum]|uniref:Protein dispatched 1 n=1 Tax=Desmophyllum pertusum TaxID=174260 RepID=A0A9W9ZDR6_9CNID|nr:Protein dispatched 1 [Desmophyllum pertusum]
MDDPELCNPAISLKSEEAPRTDEENGNNNEVSKASVQDEQTTSQCTMPRYSVVLAEYPYVVFFVTSLVIVICGLCSFVPQFNAPEIPDFSTPVMGFEPRGTVINKRYRTRLVLGKAVNRGLIATSPMPDFNITVHNMSSLVELLSSRPTSKTRREEILVRLRATIVWQCAIVQMSS